MSRQRIEEQRTDSAAQAGEGAARHSLPTAATGLVGRRAARPRSQAEAEERYIAARDAWTAAMRTANSGRPADLAALAIAQEEYEAASAERDRWGQQRAGIPVEPERPRILDVVVGQELARKRLRPTDEEQPGGFRRFVRRITGRG